MQFIDSHAHLQDYKTKNTQQIISELRNNNFAKVLCVASQTDDFGKIAALTDQAPDLLIPAFGIHPWHIAKTSPDWPIILKNILLKYTNSLVGECGIDRCHTNNLTKQQEFFQIHLRLAKELNRPLNIHLVHAEDILAQMFSQLPPKFLLHSFSGSLPFLQQALRHGAYISLNPSLLRNAKSSDIIKNIPLERLLTESDSPYQTDYLVIPDFIDKLAELKQIEPTSLSAQIHHNLQEFIKTSN